MISKREMSSACALEPGTVTGDGCIVGSLPAGFSHLEVRNISIYLLGF